MTVHSAIQPVSSFQSQERHQYGHDLVVPLSHLLSGHCPTSASAHGSEISSHVPGLGRDQTPALAQLKYNHHLVSKPPPSQHHQYFHIIIIIINNNKIFKSMLKMLLKPVTA